MPGNRIDRFNLAAKAWSGTGVDQGQARITQALLQVLGIHHQTLVELAFQVATRLDHSIQTERETCAMPGLEAAIEDKHAVALAQPGQQPPCPGGIDPRTVVIKHHIAVVIDAPCAQSFQ